MAAVGDEVPPLGRVITREDIAAYADASGDRNPLHLDDEVARAAGFPGLIAHGMFTMGHLATCISRWAGDPSRLIELTASFRSPVFVGDEIVAGGRVVASDDDIVTLETWVTLERDGQVEWPVRRGSAAVSVRERPT